MLDRSVFQSYVEHFVCPSELESHAAKPVKKGQIAVFIHDRYILRGRERATTYSWLCSAVITTVFTMSSTVQPRERSFTGLARPCMMGPTAMVFDACWTAL